jgi:hypothetical protein
MVKSQSLREVDGGEVNLGIVCVIETLSMACEHCMAAALELLIARQALDNL